MTTLKGTEKQIAWAEDIRTNCMKCAKNNLAREKEIGIDVEIWETIVANYTKFFDICDDAAKIIDQRMQFDGGVYFANKMRTGQMQVK